MDKNNKKNSKSEPMFSQSLHCGSKDYHLEIHEASSGSWLLRIREVSQSNKRKGEYDVVVYAEYLPQFLDAIDAVRRQIESDKTGTATA